LLVASFVNRGGRLRSWDYIPEEGILEGVAGPKRREEREGVWVLNSKKEARRTAYFPMFVGGWDGIKGVRGLGIKSGKRKG